MTPTHPLDNPVWASLTSRHAALSIGAGGAMRYPSEVAPFVGIASRDEDCLGQAERLVARGELVGFVGLAPTLGSGWRVEQAEPIAQMVRDAPLEVVDGPDVIEMTDAHLADMLGLTALVYPHYFRARTNEMGRYVGIYDGDRLAAMAGERMHFDGHREISAICTHPDYVGRGYARRMIAILANDILAGNELPFLHFSHANTRAKALYERMGFRFRTDIALLVATRLVDA